MKLKMLIVWVVILSACGQHKPSEDKIAYVPAYGRPDSVFDYLNAAIDTMQKYSINKDKINWKALRSQALNETRGAETYAATYPTLLNTLKNLKDDHSFLKTPEQSAAWRNATKPVQQKSASKKVLKLLTAVQQPDIGVMRAGNIAEIFVETFASGDKVQSLNYVKAIQDAVKKLDARHPKGWIINLSHNYGGNMWPMLAALGPFLQPGVQGGFRTNTGKVVPWYYHTSHVGADKDTLLTFPPSYQLKNRNLPIAVFVSERTASSAEGVIIALKNNPNVKVYGEPTAGLTTANESYKLKDGAELILTTAVFTDRKGNRFGGQIIPDVNLSEKWYYCCGHQHQIMLSAVEEWVTSYKVK